MIKTFTQNDAVFYVYGELSETEAEEFENAMLVNPALKQEVRELRQLQDSLDAAGLKPSQKVTDNILSYANSFNLHS